MFFSRKKYSAFKFPFAQFFFLKKWLAAESISGKKALRTPSFQMFFGKVSDTQDRARQTFGNSFTLPKRFFFSHAHTLSRIIHPFYVRARKLAIKKSPPICQTHVRENVFEKKKSADPGPIAKQEVARSQKKRSTTTNAFADNAKKK